MFYISLGTFLERQFIAKNIKFGFRWNTKIIFES